jgi:hypothetical protein
VKQRVQELLAQHSATRLQLVQASGDPFGGTTIVAERAGIAVAGGAPFPPLPPPAPIRGPGRPPAPPAMRQAPIDTLVNSRSDQILSTFQTTTADDLKSFRSTARARTDYSGDLSDYDVMHEIFNHETVTWPWVNTLKILDVDSGDAVPPASVTLAEGYRQERGDTITAWVDIRVEPAQGKAIWLQAGSVPVRLELAFHAPPQHGEWTLEAMSARLAPPRDLNPDLQRIWDSLWRLQRIEALSDLAQAGRAAADVSKELEEVLRYKILAPVASAIAAGLLLRAGALDYLHDWPRNLANWFAWLADGPVLWSETLLRTDEFQRAKQPIRTPTPKPAAYPAEQIRRLAALAGQPKYKDARQYFAKIAERGAPLLTTSLVMAAQRCPLWRRLLEADVLSGDQRKDLSDAVETIERPATYAATDGVFVGFASRDKLMTPQDVIGVRRRVPVRT